MVEEKPFKITLCNHSSNRYRCVHTDHKMATQNAPNLDFKCISPVEVHNVHEAFSWLLLQNANEPLSLCALVCQKGPYYFHSSLSLVSCTQMETNCHNVPLYYSDFTSFFHIFFLFYSLFDLPFLEAMYLLSGLNDSWLIPTFGLALSGSGLTTGIWMDPSVRTSSVYENEMSNIKTDFMWS